ncbi:hypothetical protein [Macrococcoides caseolyticum]|uniref:hypothetical protein n=1 Tax=Macrococcoides caseolyticum TaxID=69966 RepID=UPI0002FA5CE6|nr:hypothetical protein [Macrococcus caseolyticus]
MRHVIRVGKSRWYTEDRPQGYTTFKSKAYVTEDARKALIIAIKHDGDVEILEKENE